MVHVVLYVLFFVFIVNPLPSPPLPSSPYSLDSWILFLFFFIRFTAFTCYFFWSPFRVGLLFSASMQKKKWGGGFSLLYRFFSEFSGFLFLLFSLRGLFVPAPLRFVAIYIGSSFVSIIFYLLDCRRSPTLPVKGPQMHVVVACRL